ncbi:DUF1778 domain-containing protein [Singulisphaera sp. GP187]|uniref:type II toxin -antitoxin system TacA 1-like antitoxin n=1 Tax=Singulisphaera sp. GP187 TaxID=1882752 RepID=UPI000940DC51
MKAKLQAAAKVAHRSVSAFVLECALEQAEETLASRSALIERVRAARWPLCLPSRSRRLWPWSATLLCSW